jgi:signal transduction histidine kinase
VFLCTTDKDLVTSSKVFKRELEIHVAALRRLAQVRTELAKAEALKTRRLLHNLVSLNAHAMQDLYSVINQEHLATSGLHRNQLEVVKRELLSDPHRAARLFLSAQKNAAATKAEINVFKRLYEPAQTRKLSLAVHNIHRVILNVANYFFQEFSDQQIRLLIQETVTKIRLDYEAIQVALYHLFDNAVKYAMPGSEIRITFAPIPSGFEVAFEMQSLMVDAAECGQVFEDGYSGEEAKKLGKAGQGLGMRVIRELATLNGFECNVIWGDTALRTPKPEGPRFSLNRFALVFPKSAVASAPIVSDRSRSTIGGQRRP